MSFHTVRAVVIALCAVAIVAGDYQLRKFTFRIVLLIFASYSEFSLTSGSLFIFVFGCLRIAWLFEVVRISAEARVKDTEASWT